MSRYWAASLFFFVHSLTSADKTAVPDSSVFHASDSTHSSTDSLHTANKPIPRIPVTYQWPVDSMQTACHEPMETPAECWRQSPRLAIQEIGFPGVRSRTFSLSNFEPVSIQSFYQPALSASPYGIGGAIPFDRVEEDGRISEAWTPVLPVDTPLTSLHWMRGALQMNQFTLNLRRMVGDHTYLGLQIHSDRADPQFYEYSFNVDQPYLAGWGIPALKRDSASLVLHDTSHTIHAFQLRPRMGYWIDSQTVIEGYADLFENSSSLANPGNPGQRDSTQWLYPATFSANTYGAIAAHASNKYSTRLVYSYSNWNRTLQPNGDSAARFHEAAAGTLNRLQLEGTLPHTFMPSRIRLELENSVQQNALWLNGTSGSAPSSRASSNSEHVFLESNPTWAMLSLSAKADAGRYENPNQVEEWLGGSSGNLEAALPWNFKANGGAGWNREAASDDSLFRWQPALGFYPSPNLKPRTDLHLQTGASWENHWIGFGASWEEHRYGNSWLPRVLPEAGICNRVDSVRYRSEAEPLCPDNVHVPDSIALALVNYHQEIRDLLHLSLLLRAGNWKLSLLNTFLLKNAVQDDARLGFSELNRQLPNQLFKGQLFWRRKILDGKLGLQTQWDWEWTSTRYVYASDLNGYSRAVKLDEYLALDFTARMEIKTFMLHFRAMNLNHDRYATAPGVHPPGVNFRFGIDWNLFN